MGAMFLAPTLYAPDLDEPAFRRGPIAVYVATGLLDGRSLFDILADRFVTERLDEEPFLLADLARDPILRGLVVAAENHCGVALAA
jgi:hypothetical protein